MTCPDCGCTRTTLHVVAAEPEVNIEGGVSTLCCDCGAELEWESDAQIKADRANLREAEATGN